MQALALTAVQDRSAQDRHAQERVAARAPDRIEILSPRREDMRASARRYQEAANRFAEYGFAQDAQRFAQDEPRWSRGARTTQNSARFLAQHMAQQQPANGAHVENWRGARAAYSRADGLAQPTGASLSILI